MTPEEIRSVVVDVVTGIAPDADPDGIDPSVDLREQLDLDSFDFLNLMVGIADRTGVEVPEEEYFRVTTLDDCVAYLGRRLPSPSPT